MKLFLPLPHVLFYKLYQVKTTSIGTHFWYDRMSSIVPSFRVGLIEEKNCSFSQSSNFIAQILTVPFKIERFFWKKT